MPLSDIVAVRYYDEIQDIRAAERRETARSRMLTVRDGTIAASKFGAEAHQARALVTQRHPNFAIRSRQPDPPRSAKRRPSR